MTQRRIRELLSKEGPRIRKRFLQVMQRVKDRHTAAELEQALSEGRISEYLDDIEKAAGAVASRLEALRTMVGHETADFLSTQVDKLVSYDAANDKAVALVRSNRARLVSAITEAQRGAIADILSDGTAAGVNPREMAVHIRDVIGLTRKQASNVTAYRRRLTRTDPTPAPDADGVVAPGPKPRPPAQVDRMVERYANRQLKARAEAIARTEAKGAVDETLHNTFEQAIGAGSVDATQIEMKWLAGDPPRTRPHHAVMDGQIRAWGESFRDGLGNELRYPGDRQAPPETTVQCRCAVSRRLVRMPDAKAA